MFCIEVSKETKISDTMVLLRLFDYQGALTVRYHRLRSFYRRRLFAAYNVWAKVKKELANRTNGKLYEKNGFLYYEDLVYGISKLRSWLYGYSSSAVVLEPAELRQQIIDSLKTRQMQNFDDEKYKGLSR